MRLLIPQPKNARVPNSGGNCLDTHRPGADTRIPVVGALISGTKPAVSAAAEKALAAPAPATRPKPP